MDTDKPQNAAFLEKFPIQTWPTLLVIDPATEQPVLKWLGTANVTQIEQLLQDGERALRGGRELEGKLAKADRLNAKGQSANAIAVYQELLREAPPEWPRRARVIESLLLAAATSGNASTCAQTAQSMAPGMARGPSFANAVSIGLSCALDAPAAEPWRQPALEVLEPLAREAVELPDILADDRAGLYSVLVQARQDAGDEAGAKALATSWWRFLEFEARMAHTVEGRASLDGFRVEAALALKDPARALPLLQQSERELLEDYNPSARVAVLYRELGVYDKAETAARRALAKVYGPRRIRVLETLGSILAKQNRVEEARATYAEALKVSSQLPAARRSATTEKRIQRAMDGLPTRAP